MKSNRLVWHSLGKKEELVQGKVKQAGRQAGRREIDVMLAGRNVRSVVRHLHCCRAGIEQR